LRCRDESVAERVRTDRLGDPSAPRHPSDDTTCAVAVEAAAVSTEEDRPFTALADHKVDGAGRAWGERDL